MNFRDFAAVNLQRCKRWHPNGIKSWSVSLWALAAAGEAGELSIAMVDAMCVAMAAVGKAAGVGNAVKKLNRVEDNMQQKAGPQTLEDAQRAVATEIGDTVCYLDLLAQRMGTTLEDCVVQTFNRISDREGFPEKLNESEPWTNVEAHVHKLYAHPSVQSYLIVNSDERELILNLQNTIKGGGRLGVSAVYDTMPF